MPFGAEFGNQRGFHIRHVELTLGIGQRIGVGHWQQLHPVERRAISESAENIDIALPVEEAFHNRVRRHTADIVAAGPAFRPLELLGLHRRH